MRFNPEQGPAQS